MQAMLDRYHGTLAQLSPVEANLMQLQLASLRSSIRPGFTPLNWNSLHITAYISDVTKALQDFDNTLSQVRKDSAYTNTVAPSPTPFRSENLALC
jgi:dynein heavy chain